MELLDEKKSMCMYISRYYEIVTLLRCKFTFYKLIIDWILAIKLFKLSPLDMFFSLFSVNMYIAINTRYYFYYIINVSICSGYGTCA